MGRFRCRLVLGTTAFLCGIVRTSTGAPIDVIPTGSTPSSAIVSSIPTPTTTPAVPTPTGPVPCANESGCPKGYQCQDGLCEHTKQCGGFVGIQCPNGYFCLTPPGTADVFGTCIKVPKYLIPCDPPCPEPRYCIDPLQICASPIPQLLEIDSSTPNDTPTATTSIIPTNLLTSTFPTQSTGTSAITSSVPAPTTTSGGPEPTGSVPCSNGTHCSKGYQCQDGICQHTKQCGGFIGIDCPDGYFCLTPPGTADAFGTCINIPKFPLHCNSPCPEPRYCIDPLCEIQICVPPIPELLEVGHGRLSRRQDPGVVFWTSISPEPTLIESAPPIITEVIPWTPVFTPIPIISQNATTTAIASHTSAGVSVSALTSPEVTPTPLASHTSTSMSVSALFTVTSDATLPSMSIL